MTSGNVLRELPEIIREEERVREMDGENCWSKQKKENNCNHGRRNVGGSKEGGIREEMHKEWTLVMERRRKGRRVRERERERETDSCSSAEA